MCWKYLGDSFRFIIKRQRRQNSRDNIPRRDSVLTRWIIKILAQVDNVSVSLNTTFDVLTAYEGGLMSTYFIFNSYG